MLYFDNAATTMIDKDVLDAMMPYYLNFCGNPSTLYSYGRESKAVINNARNSIANSINCDKNELFFATNASECNNIALKVLIEANSSKGKHILCSNIEHPSVYNTVEKYRDFGYEIEYLEADSDGLISNQELQSKLRSDTAVVAVMHVNNEIGSIQDIESLCQIAHNNGSLFYSDTVQSIGHCSIDFKKSNLDAMCISAHKIYGPKGIACLVLNNKFTYKPFIYGGGQQRNLISGTENVPGIVAISKAISIAVEDLEINNKLFDNLRSYLLAELNKSDIKFELNSNTLTTVSNIINIRFIGKRNDIILNKLDLKGICVSAGSACSSGAIKNNGTVFKVKKSDLKAAESIRISFSKYNTVNDIEQLISALKSL